MEFTIQKKVVRVPTEFIFLNGMRLSWSDFESSLKALEALNPQEKRYYGGGIERQELRHLLQISYDQDWIKTWASRGVVTPYNYDWDNDDRTVTTEMVKAGPAYKPFMKAVRTFAKTLAQERAKAHKEALRKSLQDELQALDAEPTLINSI